MRLAMHYNKQTHGFALESVPLGADPASADTVIHSARCGGCLRPGRLPGRRKPVARGRRVLSLARGGCAATAQCTARFPRGRALTRLARGAPRPFLDRLWGGYLAGLGAAAGAPPKVADAAVLLSAGDAAMAGKVASAMGLAREQARAREAELPPASEFAPFSGVL